MTFSREFIEARGVTPDGPVAGRRGYTDYAAAEREKVYQVADQVGAPIMRSRSAAGWVAKFTKSEGVLIPKYPARFPETMTWYKIPNGLESERGHVVLEPIRLQIRPRHEVVTGVWRHRHDSPGREYMSLKGWSQDDLRTATRAQLFERGEWSPMFRVTRGRWVPNTLEGLAMADHMNGRADEHVKVGPRRMHEHRETAKYGIPVRVDQVEADGTAWRTDDATRLDVHPIVSDYLDGRRRPGPWFVGIEGTTKGDAMLEALLALGLPPQVISVPGVGMWHAPELDYFAWCYMRDDPVLIVPDADWATNPEVIYHAENCAAYMRRALGLRADIAAPPTEADAGDAYAKGADDYLAVHRGNPEALLRMPVLRRRLDPVAWASFEDDYRSKSDRTRRIEAESVELDLRVARIMHRYATQDGSMLRSTRSLARVLFGRRVSMRQARESCNPEFMAANDAADAFLAMFFRRPPREIAGEIAEAEQARVHRSMKRLEEWGAFDVVGELDWVDAVVPTAGSQGGTVARRGYAPRRQILNLDHRLRAQVESVPIDQLYPGTSETRWRNAV